MWLLEKINKPLARLTRKKLSKVIKIRNKENSPGECKWLGLCPFTARGPCLIPGPKLRSHKPRSANKERN